MVLKQQGSTTGVLGLLVCALPHVRQVWPAQHLPGSCSSGGHEGSGQQHMGGMMKPHWALMLCCDRYA